MSENILVTGAAGFIGFHLSQKLLDEGYTVVGLDNLNPYYDVNLKHARIKLLEKNKNFKLVKLNLEDKENIFELFKNEKFDRVAHLAAQAGVRYSLEKPFQYTDANVTGFLSILEGCRHHQIKHLIYASTSSVYGSHTNIPFSEHESVDHPISLYAATKKANELMAHCYSHLYQIPTTGLRFFTVYGPWGRPDMALFLFTKAMLSNEPIQVFNHGKMKRDFTYVADVVESLSRVLKKPAKPNSNWDSSNPDPASSSAPYKIYNIGNNSPVDLMDYINALEDALGKKAEMNMMPMQMGDVPSTYANVDELAKDFDFKPKTSVKDGINSFVKWYREFYQS